MRKAKDFFKGLGNQFASDYYEFLKLIPKCNYDDYEIAMIYKALHKALELHDGQIRKSGEPYINHPIGASSILAGYGLDYEVVCAALLHDTIEDTNYTLSECSYDFGNVIATLVDGVTKIGNDVNKLTKQKILNSIKVDARSIAVKSADRLHNMYTLEYLSENKQKEIATETRDFYLPISKILGIYKLKDEFQDLCLYYLDNDNFLKYYEIRNNLKFMYNDKLIELGDTVQSELSKKGIAMQYEHRVKNIGGIYEEIKRHNFINMPEENIYESLSKIDDLLAIKMILSDENLCYKAFDVTNDVCQDVKLRTIKDYILEPKENGYRSLNFNVTYKDTDAQIRIRTDQMQSKNNIGVFSDWNNDTQDKINSDLKDGLDALARKIVR